MYVEYTLCTFFKKFKICTLDDWLEELSCWVWIILYAIFTKYWPVFVYTQIWMSCIDVLLSGTSASWGRNMYGQS